MWPCSKANNHLKIKTLQISYHRGPSVPRPKQFQAACWNDSWGLKDFSSLYWTIRTFLSSVQWGQAAIGQKEWLALHGMWVLLWRPVHAVQGQVKHLSHITQAYHQFTRNHFTVQSGEMVYFPRLQRQCLCRNICQRFEFARHEITTADCCQSANARPGFHLLHQTHHLLPEGWRKSIDFEVRNDLLTINKASLYSMAERGKRTSWAHFSQAQTHEVIWNWQT